ncbi:hypothetical protein GUITHDRAFT_143098 [Guillardia theta CCMP2712]|uniref:C2 domain-containing protein n=1 Tax=Guillardia theta (strain CCMP2712) TaxID=905079 RepID=L1IUM1_GUITC|nr:hypothetical protein GUITHDRAFT_143098 [Guillardia theta CCMP2712]EKX39928.1 hypothetical protein GUITHDRAFT_143098 [Guillardia theta CCMP2712]|eukprot:XP_005826908.1 hypothetical protein GUITHDRAFT_143098 [Guillardia theta CCMP2712]
MVAKRRKKRTVERELDINIVSARYLPAMDPNGLCDCFCRIKLNDALMGKMKTIYRNRNRRVRRWFGVRRIEAEYKAWETRARSEDEWIRETHDGELAVSEENNVSEVTEICNPKVAKGCSRPVGTLDYHGESKRPSTTAAAQTLLGEQGKSRSPENGLARLVEGSGRHGVENVKSYISMSIRIASVEANEGRVPQCKQRVFRAVETCERLVGAQRQVAPYLALSLSTRLPADLRGDQAAERPQSVEEEELLLALFPLLTSP